jgi:carbon storage regulator
MHGNLVLSRKAGERINIGDEITVEVTRINGNRCSLKVSAPREMRILRSELPEAGNGLDETSRGIPAE